MPLKHLIFFQKRSIGFLEKTGFNVHFSLNYKQNSSNITVLYKDFICKISKLRFERLQAGKTIHIDEYMPPLLLSF